MPSVPYMNQTAPFWDFIASLEDQGATHPWFANRGEASEGERAARPNPWTDGWAALASGPLPYRARRGGPHAHRGPHGHRGAATQEGSDEVMNEASSTEKEQDPEEGPSDAREGQSESETTKEGKRAGARHGGCAGRGRGAPGRGRGACGAGARDRHGAPHGGPHRGFPFGPFGPLAGMFQNQFGTPGANNEDGTFTPDVDVFDTAESYVIHVSLPGAKKEDVGVNWDSEKSELSIAGVVTRPGDEEFLKTLAMDERKVGAFERKVRLGSAVHPAQVEVDAISARMEDGVLRIDVPKLDSGYVEIKKVDIE